MLTSLPAEGVMSGIISAKPFNTVFTATDGNSTMQGTVTALYEIGMVLLARLHPPRGKRH
jgi:hypothetical protein